MRKKIIAATTTAGLVAAAGIAIAAHAPVYDAELVALNDSGASGTVDVDVDLGPGTDGGDATDDASITISISAAGLSADLPHAAHLHAPAEDSAACPTMDLDADGDGLTVVEGAPAYGGVVLSLTTGDASTGGENALNLDVMPTADSEGNLTYERTITGLDDSFVSGIGSVAVVLHGVADADPTGESDTAYDGDKPSSLNPDVPFEATAPAVCGTVDLAQSFGVTVDRLGGIDRTATAAAISRDLFDTADTVYLANARSFPDALAAGTVTDGPILLVEPARFDNGTAASAIPAATAAELERLLPSKIVVLGGEAAIPQTTVIAATRIVKDKLDEMAG